jgi:predicted TIM-barrel fold metal-dependent hydrolase
LRIDAHHSHTDQYSLAYLESILKRNRFEKSMLVGSPQPTPDYVAGIIAPIDSFPIERPNDRRIRALQVRALPDVSRAATLGLPVDLLNMLPHVSEIARQYQGVTLIVDHLGHPPTDTWARDIELAAACPNVFCKLSGLTMFGEPRPYVQRALSLFGAGRLMFGSDWPNGLPRYTWKAALAVFTQAIGPQPIEVREQLLGGTAARVYRLAAPGG